MGMFDSLYIELDGRELEVQTKRFECVLRCYRVGDWIDGAPSGIRVYFDTLTLDETGRSVYCRSIDEAARTLTLFVVIAQAVFVEYRLREGALAPDAIEQVIRDLRERWSDSARLVEFLAESVRRKQESVERLDGQLVRVSSVLNRVRRMQAGETFDGAFDRIHEQDRKLADGEDPLDVLEWVLSTEAAGWGRGRLGPAPDPLDEYRL